MRGMTARRPMVAESRGFTLVEAVIASAILSTAVISALLVLGTCTNAVAASRRRTVATIGAVQKIEELRSLTWAIDAAGVRTSDLTSNPAVDPLSSGGVGFSARTDGTLYTSTGGYVDYLDASGTWVGDGTSIPAAAVFVRRWAVIAAAADPADTLVIVVVVRTVVADRAAGRPDARCACLATSGSVQSSREG